MKSGFPLLRESRSALPISDWKPLCPRNLYAAILSLGQSLLSALTFLIDLGYKGELNRENVDYSELIWEDFAYQIDQKKEINTLKFVRIGEDYQEYGLPIPDVMLTDAIKHSESYQMFIKYSTNQIPPKKSRGKGSKAKKKTSSKRRVKKKVTLLADVNIISNDPDASLELAKSISQTEAKEAGSARKVHSTHARIVTEYVLESAKKKCGGRSSKSVVIQDTLSTLKSKPATSKTKLKGAPSLTPQEQEAGDIMQALKESKKTSRRQPGTGGSNEGTGSKPGVPDESTVVSATSSEGTGAKLGVLDEEKDITEEKDDKDGDADNEGDDHVSDTHDADDEDDETESDEDEIYKYKIRVRKDEDGEMKDAEVEESDKGEEKVTDVAKEEAEKTSEVKDDTKKSELPPSSSSLSISLVPKSNALTVVELRVAKLEKDVSDLKTIDHSTEALAVLVTHPDGAWTEYVSGGVTLLNISSTKHKERPLR
ncbi:hypothetical protein Tco_1160622, partial [Tanacetum coccineum]